MTTSHLPPQSDPPLSPRLTLPTMYDLPSENPEEPGLPDEYHAYQPLLLRYTFKPINCDLEEVFIGADINLYYDLRHLNWYKRPDWFAVVGVDRLYENRELRNSYVMWQELVSPFVVIELLSPGTEAEDLGQMMRKPGKSPTKWQVYEQILRIPYYFVFSRYTNQLQAFRLVGSQYESVEVGESGFLIPQLGLRLGLWQGSFENIERLWLRWFNVSGELILTPNEEAATDKARAERFAAKLRELNIDPDVL